MHIMMFIHVLTCMTILADNQIISFVKEHIFSPVCMYFYDVCVCVCVCVCVPVVL